MPFSDLVDRFRDFGPRIHAPNRAFFEELSQGQTPDTFVIACSDSRLMPQDLTGAKAGELFVARNAGNMVPRQDQGTNEGVKEGTVATLEFAVLGLGVQHIIVLGHSDCGAMKALRNGAPEALPHLRAWMAHGQAALESVGAEADLRTLTQSNIATQITNLRSFAFVEDRVEDGRLHLHGWYYDIAAGQTAALDPATGQFAPVAQVYRRSEVGG